MKYRSIYSPELLKNLAPGLIKNSIFLKVVEELIQIHIIKNIKYLVHIDRIDEMNEEELDFIAQELHVDYYNYRLSTEQKRELCKKSFYLHSIKGTVKAVKDMLDIFYTDTQLVECHDDEHMKAGTFKIEIHGKSEENLSELLEKVENVKKKSQLLEGVIFKNKIKTNLVFASGRANAVMDTIKPSPFSVYIKNINLNTKSGHYTFAKGKY